MYTYTHTHLSICIIRSKLSIIFKGQLRRRALWQLVLDWYKSCPLDLFGRAEMNDSTTLSHTDSAVLDTLPNSCAFVLRDE